MEILGIELSDWKNKIDYISRENNYDSFSFVDIQYTPIKTNIYFGGRLEQLQSIFNQQYGSEKLEKLSIQKLKNLVDQFLLQIKEIEAFI